MNETAGRKRMAQRFHHYLACNRTASNDLVSAPDVSLLSPQIPTRRMEDSRCWLPCCQVESPDDGLKLGSWTTFVEGRFASGQHVPFITDDRAIISQGLKVSSAPSACRLASERLLQLRQRTTVYGVSFLSLQPVSHQDRTRAQNKAFRGS